MSYHIGMTSCFVCRSYKGEKAGLQPEGGITVVSLHNAHVMVSKHGKPSAVELSWNADDDCLVILYWTKPDHQKKRFVLTGFAWGYGGEGPRGLYTFLEWIGIKVVRGEIGTWPMSHEFEKKTFLKGSDYDLNEQDGGV